MKAQVLASLALAGSTLAFPSLQRRQSKGILSAPTKVIQKPFKYTETQGTLRTNSKHVTVVYGPYNVGKSQSAKGAKPGMGGMGGHSHSGGGGFENAMDPDGHRIGGPVQEGICKGCTVLRARAEITDVTGRAMSIGSGIYLHHIVVAATQSKNVSRVFGACANSPPKDSKASNQPSREGGLGQGRIVFAQGIENFTTTYTTKNAGFNSGYHTGNGPYVLVAEVINYKPEDIPVYISVDYEYVPGIVGQDANMAILNVNGCMDKGIALYPPPHQKSVIPGGEVPVLQDGTIVSARGHLHDGGVGIKMYLNGKLVCNSLATYGGSEATLVNNGKKWETLSSMSECGDAIPVKKGDMVKLEASFDTETHPTRISAGEEQEGMGLYILSFVPNKN